jgi:hypothetical protein
MSAHKRAHALTDRRTRAGMRAQVPESEESMISAIVAATADDGARWAKEAPATDAPDGVSPVPAQMGQES